MKPWIFVLLVAVFGARVFGAFTCESDEISLDMQDGRLSFDGLMQIAADPRWIGGDVSADLRVAIQGADMSEPLYLYPAEGEESIAWTPPSVDGSGEYTLRLERKDGDAYVDTGISREIIVERILKVMAQDIDITIPSGTLFMNEGLKVSYSSKWGGIEGGTSRFEAKNIETGETEAIELGNGESYFDWCPDAIGEYELVHDVVLEGKVTSSVTQKVVRLSRPVSDISVDFGLDVIATGSENRRSTDGRIEYLTFSRIWDGKRCPEVAVTVNDVPVALGDGDEGTVEWKPTEDGIYVLKHTVVSEDGEMVTDIAAFEVTGVPAPVITPLIIGDNEAEVTGDNETGFVVKPGAGNRTVEVTIPAGVRSELVTVEVAPETVTVKPNGAKVKIVREANGERYDITRLLDVPAAVDGVVDIARATVKEQYAKEPLDVEKGAVVTLESGTPAIKTAPTQKGLTYNFYEAATLEALFGDTPADTIVGNGEAWQPEISVKGGDSGFYSIKVEK